MTNKRHIILQLILASVSQALGGSSNSTEYDCAYSNRCYESSSNEASFKVFIGILAAALMGTLFFTSGECTNVRREEDLILLSKKEIIKNAHTIHHASKIKSCIFSRIPDGILAKIAGLTGDQRVHTEEESDKIARKVIWMLPV